MKIAHSSGCCQLREIYGFGNSVYDGTLRNTQVSAEEFERELLERERSIDYVSMAYLTINSDQHPILSPVLKKLKWRLVNVVNSIGHPTVIFMYVKNSSKTSIESTKNRLTNLGIETRIPGDKIKKAAVE